MFTDHNVIIRVEETVEKLYERAEIESSVITISKIIYCFVLSNLKKKLLNPLSLCIEIQCE